MSLPPYPIEKMRKFIVEKYPHNDDMCHSDHRAGALMSAILRWWDDEEKPFIDQQAAYVARLEAAYAHLLIYINPRQS
jgi:hypothetical protein